MSAMMTSDQAAARLGVKVATLYVYVSRGLLQSHPAPDRRRSLFAAEDVEALARRSRGGRQIETRMAVVNTSITQLREDGPSYRGRPAVELAGSVRFEQVAELLWRQEGEWSADPEPLPGVERLAPRDALALGTVLLGSRDPLRSDLRPVAVARAARRLIASLARIQPRDPTARGDTQRGRAPSTTDTTDTTGTTAHELTVRLCSVPPSPDVVAAMDAALVLLADHELATSTLAVRVAACTRAGLHDAVLAGLGTLAGPLHGSASQYVAELLQRASVDGVAPTLDAALRWQGIVAGFGHAAYPNGDPRATRLLELVDVVATDDLRALLAQVHELAGAHELPPPNIDLALGALAVATGIRADTIPVVFAIARCAGWVAHYLEELEERPLRFRARAVHVTSD